MNRAQNGRIIRIIVSVLLMAALILPTSLTANVANAAAKPAIEATIKIGTGSLVGNFDYYSKSDKYSLSVSNAVKNAVYSYTSSNTKVLTVKANGTEVFLTGVTAGTAVVTCNQKLKGKTTKVGTCKVTVVNSSILRDYNPEIPLGTSAAKDYLEIAFRNNDATYTYVSDSKNFSMKENITKFDDKLFNKLILTAAAPGTYTVTVKETYNKKTRVVGKIKFIAKKAAVESTNTIDMGSDISGFGDIVANYREDVPYLFEAEDKDVVEVEANNGEVILKGKKVGSTNINVYENAKTADKSKLLGTCKVSVKEVVLESLDCSYEKTEAAAGDEPVSVEVSKEPSNAVGDITVTSSDPKVAKVSSIDEDGNFTVTPVSEGTATITVTCGTMTKTQDFTVTKSAE